MEKKQVAKEEKGRKKKIGSPSHKMKAMI